jgi:hypothetical protein
MFDMVTSIPSLRAPCPERRLFQVLLVDCLY